VKLNPHWKAILTTLSFFMDFDRLPVSTLAMWSGADISDVNSVLYALRPFVGPNDQSLRPLMFDLKWFLETCGEWDRSAAAVEPVFRRVLAVLQDLPGLWDVLRSLVHLSFQEQGYMFGNHSYYPNPYRIAIHANTDIGSVFMVIKALDPLLSSASNPSCNDQFLKYLASTLR